MSRTFRKKYSSSLFSVYGKPKSIQQIRQYAFNTLNFAISNYLQEEPIYFIFNFRDTILKIKSDKYILRETKHRKRKTFKTNLKKRTNKENRIFKKQAISKIKLDIEISEYFIWK